MKSDDLLGQTIAGRYRIISRLGAGGMGVAYRAWDESASLPVVIKIPKRAFLDDPTFAERFAREIRLLQGLEHPHIVPIVDVGEHDGMPFVVMRFLPGGALSNRRLRGDDGKTRPNPPGMLHLWLPAVADALDFIHSSGVVHRDVKPANIFFDAFWNAFLGDFGIAKIVTESDAFDREATLTATSMGIGTPDYMAPEMFTPKAVIDGRVDQYALAVIAYEMLAGTRPFTGDLAHVLIAVTNQPPPRLDQQVAGVPASAVDAVHRGLAKKPADRFPSCRQFAAALLRDIPSLADEPDTARFLCPNCSNLLKLPGTAAGRKGKCPKCKEEMQVAADLGALWLLDEVERQQAGPAGQASVTDWTLAQDGAAADDAAPEFTPISTLKGGTKIARRPKGFLPWIDSHGLAVAVLLGAVTAASWVQSARPPAPQPTPPDTSVAPALRKELEAAVGRTDQLAKDVATLTASRADLLRRLDVLKSEAGQEPPQTPTAAVPATPPAVSAEDDLQRELEAMLTKDPLDPKTNERLGRLLCFTKADWDAGLLYFKRAGKNSPFFDPASQELLVKTTTNHGGLLRVAQQWWDFQGGQDCSAAELAAIRAHATTIYKQHAQHAVSSEDLDFTKRWLDADPDFAEAVGGQLPRVVGTGLRGEYFRGKNFSGLVLTQIDATLDRDYVRRPVGQGVPTQNFAIRWSGTIVPEHTDDYTFFGYCDDGITIKIDEKVLFTNMIWAENFRSPQIRLESGKSYKFVVEYVDHGKGNARLTLKWKAAAQPADELVPTRCLYPADP